MVVAVRGVTDDASQLPGVSPSWTAPPPGWSRTGIPLRHELELERLLR